MNHVETLEKLKTAIEESIVVFSFVSDKPDDQERYAAALTTAIEALRLIEGAKREYIIMGYPADNPQELSRWNDKGEMEARLAEWRVAFPKSRFTYRTFLTIDVEEPNV